MNTTKPTLITSGKYAGMYHIQIQTKNPIDLYTKDIETAEKKIKKFAKRGDIKATFHYGKNGI